MPKPSPVRAAAGAAFALSAATLAAAAAEPFGAPSPQTPASLYEARCGGCHALDRNKYGPMHRGVVGRAAATQPGYRYSDALRRSGIVWTEPTLDAWLDDPRRLVPGTRMDARLKDPEARRQIIAYLRDVAR